MKAIASPSGENVGAVSALATTRFASPLNDGAWNKSL